MNRPVPAVCLCLPAVLAGALGAQSSPSARPAAPALEMRIVASQDYDAGGVRFDLDEERRRLRQWLDGGGRALLASDPRNIGMFHARSEFKGGRLSRHLRWYPHEVRPEPGGEAWGHAYSRDDLPAVAAFSEEDYRAGPGSGRRRLIGLIAVNMHAEHFRAADLAPESLRVVADETGRPAIRFGIRAERSAAYADWSERHLNDALAVIVDGFVRSAAVIRSRLPGAGMISGGFAREEAERLVATLRGAASSPAGARTDGAAETEVIGFEKPSQAPASADPADLRAIQGAQAMLAAERKLEQMIKDGKITGIDRILTFEEISSWPYEDGLKGMPKQLNKLDGKKVMMTGFMLPIDEVENIREFLLVQSLWSCCYGQPPDINGIVRVVMKGDERVDYKFDPIKVIGDFAIEATMEDGYCVDIYQLHAVSVEVIE